MEQNNTTITLHEPDSREWSQMQTQLESRCNKQELLRYADALTPWLGKYQHIMRATDDGQPKEATECADMAKQSTSKWAIAQGVALIIADERNMKAYVDQLSIEMKSLWRLVLVNVFVSMKTAKHVLGVSHDLYKKNSSYYYYSSDNYTWNRREYGWFTATDCYDDTTDKWGTRNRVKYITVSSWMRQLFFKYFFPEVEDSDPSLAELPEGEWNVVNLEANSVSNYNLFCGLFQQGEFPLRKNGVGVSDIKRAKKKMTLKEIFDGDSSHYHDNLRTYYYLQLLTVNQYDKLKTKSKNKKKDKAEPADDNYEDTLRDLIANFSRFDLYLPAMLFPHIKGLRKQMTDYSREPRLAQMLFSWLREEPERWISINDLILNISAMESDGTTSRYSTLVFHPNDEQYSTIIVNEYSGHTITAADYTREFGYTALQTLALLLCSIGVAEVALSDDHDRKLSPFDTVDYLRLTPLGRYALGVTDDYEAPEQEHAAYFELDAERLIIRSLVNPNPYAQLLTDTSLPISHDRFQTSALSFLANCHKREDVESKISIFRRFISSDLPPLWEEFFQQLLQHCHPLKEDKTGYKRYTIAADNHDLIQLITTDPVLRQLVIRAEGYRIMVRNDDLSKFENQLKKHGYLL